MEGSAKRTIAAEEKKIILLLNSWSGDKSCAIFEVYIKLQTCFYSSSSSSSGRSKKVSYDVESDYPEGDNSIYPILAFFNERPENPIVSVAACLLDSKLYMVPYDEPDAEPFEQSFYDELDLPPPIVTKKLTPVVFDLKDHSTKPLPELIARKVYPIVAAVGTDKVFSFTSYFPRITKFPEPCFESLDLNYSYNDKLCWKELPCYHLHKKCRITGYAVLADDFMLCSLETSDKEVVFGSYNIRSTIWKDVIMPPPEKPQPCFFRKEGLVVGNDIYTYEHNPMKLFVFSYKRTPAGVNNYDLSLTAACAVKGLEFGEKDYFRCSGFFKTSAIAKLNDGILCLLHTLCPPRALDDVSVLHVRVCIIQLQKRELCTTLKSFECKLHTGRDILLPFIKSSHIWNLNEASDRRGGKRAVRSSNADDNVFEEEMDCGGT